MTKNNAGLARLLLTALVLLEGCAMDLSPRSLREPDRSQAPTTGAESSGSQGSGGGFPEQAADTFQDLQEASGLERAARHPVGAALYPTQARELLRQLTLTPWTWRNQVPRQALSWLLREVLAGNTHVDPTDLSWRANRFDPLVLLRADGYLVAALTGRPIQRMGRLE